MTETSEKLEMTAQSTAQETDSLPRTELDVMQKEINRFTKKKSKKKKFIIIGVLVLLVGAFAAKTMLGGDKALSVSTTPFEKTDLSNMVSVTGTIESADAVRVYSALGSTVNEISVQVGDQVQEGDLLALLDTADLELSIAQQRATLNQTAKLNEHNLTVSEKRLENAKDDISSGMDAQLISAENSLRSAQQALNDARRDYSDAQDVHTDADDDLTAAEKRYDKAKKAADTLEAALKAEQNKPTPDAAEIARLEGELKTAEKELDTANSELRNAEANSSSLSRERSVYRQARVSYENALSHYNATKNASGQSIDSLKDGVIASEISSDLTSQQIALEKLNKQLDDSKVTAPISGTITAVYAKVGAPANGLMFVIEDTEELIIKTRIKEYDVTTVKEGMPSTIKSDATGEQVFDGEVKRIYPAAVKSADGSTQTNGNVEFETEVALTSKDTGLRVGMNVRMNIITAKKDGIYAVPYDSVATNAEGQRIVYVTKPNAEGKMIAQSIPVTTGMETDFYIEISADGLSDGDPIISDPTMVTEGMEVAVMPSAGAAAKVG